jgi:hypothetical protein
MGFMKTSKLGTKAVGSWRHDFVSFFFSPLVRPRLFALLAFRLQTRSLWKRTKE